MRVCLVKGGISNEREISLLTGDAYAGALKNLGYQYQEVDFTGDVANFVEQLIEYCPDVILNALHGTGGEDGQVQGLFDLLKIPYTHSSVLTSALAMNKHMTKSVLESVGISCPEGFIINPKDLLVQEPFMRPFIIKPNMDGSSFGVNIVNKETDLTQIVDNWSYGEMLVERYIAGRELTVGLLGHRPLAVTEIVPITGRFYDYESKYSDNVAAKHVLPAPVCKPIYDSALSMALKAVQALDCKGISRVDFRYNDTKGEPGDLYVLEVNTQPGGTKKSLVPEQANYVGITNEQLVDWMVKQACGNQ